MDKIKVKITEVKEIFKINKKGEKIEDKSMKLANSSGNVVLSVKGKLAKDFTEEDRGKKATIEILFENKEGDKNQRKNNKFRAINERINRKIVCKLLDS